MEGTVMVYMILRAQCFLVQAAPGAIWGEQGCLLR